MRKMLYKFFSWVMSYGAEPIQPRSPNVHDLGRSNRSTQFTVIKAENGTVLQTYNYSIDGALFWVVPEGSSVGNMVDTVLVAEKLK